VSLLTVLVLVLILAFATGSHSLFYLAYVSVALVIGSRLWIARTLGGLRLERHMPLRAFCGERVDVSLRVTNTWRLPVLWLYLHESLPIALHTPNFVRQIVSLAPRESVQVNYALECGQRGFFELGPLALQTGDFFGLAPDMHAHGPTQRFVVYPRIVPLPRLQMPSNTAFGYLPVHAKLFQDPNRFFGVRDYQRGDSLRTVHWTSSARLSRLQVKRFEPAVALRCMIVLDLNATNYHLGSSAAAEELGCTLAASIAARLTELRQAMGVAILAKDQLSELVGLQTIPVGQGRDHLILILEALAKARMAPTTPITDWLPQAASGLGWGSTVILITAGDSVGLLASIVNLQRRGANVVVIATDSRKPFAALKGQLENIGVPAYWITSEKELGRWP